LAKLSKTHSNDMSTLLTREEHQRLSEETHLQLQKMHYSCADVRSMNLTTDQYIDKFLPF
jgi:hypothetical protein